MIRFDLIYWGARENCTGKMAPNCLFKALKVHLIHYLKLQSVTFTSLSPSMFENLELQFLAELSSVRGVVIRCSGTAPARINLMFWGECVVVSHCTGVDIYLVSRSQTRIDGRFHWPKPAHEAVWPTCQTITVRFVQHHVSGRGNVATITDRECQWILCREL